MRYLVPYLLAGVLTTIGGSGYDDRMEIRYPDGTAVRFNEEDLLWTAKLVQGEGARTEEEAAAIVWTLVQRRYWGTGMARPNPRAFAGYRSWHTYVQTFSQALNPKWLRTGEFCRPGGAHAATGYCSTERLRRRDVLARATWDQLDPMPRAVALAFVEGKVPNVAPGVVDFRAGDDVVVRMPVATLAFPTRNRFFYSHGSTSRAWGGAGIRVETGAVTSFEDVILGLLPGGRDLYAMR